MSWAKVAAARCLALVRRTSLEDNLNDEVRAHLDMLVDENVRRGMSLEEARYAALRIFGGVSR